MPNIPVLAAALLALAGCSTMVPPPPLTTGHPADPATSAAAPHPAGLAFDQPEEDPAPAAAPDQNHSHDHHHHGGDE